MNQNPISSNDLALLRKYDTPTVCNVIELFNIRPRNSGYMDRRISACFPDLPPMIGYATTATFCASIPGSVSAYSDLDRQVQAFTQVAGPRVVVFQDLDEPSAAATFGEVMCTTYQTFGACGLITSGAARDLDQVRSLEFPAFSNGMICSHGYTSIPEINIDVHVGGITIHPGDLLHGDRNGVTTIPLEIASEVAGACETFTSAEAVILDYLRSGEATPAGLHQAQQEMRLIVDDLRRRLVRA